MPFWICNNGIAILNADRVAEPVQRSGRSPEVSELPITFQIDRVKDDMIMDMLLICVGRYDVGVIPVGFIFDKIK